MKSGELVDIDRITIGVRRRDDLGDLSRLIDSIHRVGLIHPIVVTDDLTLVAGHRRLEASRWLGATMIEVRRMGDLSEAEVRELELEENLHRKDLTPAERSKTLTALATAVKTRLLENASALESQGSEGFFMTDVEKPRGGAPAKPDAQKKVAAEMGLSVGTLNMAQRHTKAIERYPELAAPDVSQREAIRQAAAPTTPTPKKRRRRRPVRPTVEVPVTRSQYMLMAGFQQVLNDFGHSGGLTPLFAVWSPAERTQAMGQLQTVLSQLQALHRPSSSRHSAPSGA